MIVPLLHLATPAEWRAHLAAGVIAPSVAEFAEFVHLSTVEQVALPAARLFAGRRDLLMLALDPARIGVEVRFEPGLPSDPRGLRFPHAYGPVPVSAVLAVLPYRPLAGGGFDPPGLPALDDAGRLTTLVASVLRRAADHELSVTGGIAISTEPGGSQQHNQLLVDGPTTVAALVADMAGCTLARLTGPDAVAVAGGVCDLGWEVEHMIGMAARAGGNGDSRVEQLDVDAVAPMWEALWRSEPPPPNPDLVQSAARYRTEDAVTDVRCLAVRESGRVVAAAVLKLDGATGWLETLITVPGHRRRGHGGALLDEALAVAGRGGCDLVGLEVLDDDWPRRWYARRGFAEVAESWAIAPPV